MTGSLPAATLYTDGGCRPNPGPGGWAAGLLRPGEDPQDLSGSEPETTNNRMELRAAIEGLRALPAGHRVELFTDSEYVRKGITEWHERWRRNGWRTAAKKEVQNADLWRDAGGRARAPPRQLALGQGACRGPLERAGRRAGGGRHAPAAAAGGRPGRRAPVPCPAISG